jgi:antitoxin FitA
VPIGTYATPTNFHQPRDTTQAQPVVYRLPKKNQSLGDAMSSGLQRRARRHGRSTEEEVREILRNAVRDEGVARSRLGSRLRKRFAGIGLEDDLAEWRGETVPPGVFGP